MTTTIDASGTSAHAGPRIRSSHPALGTARRAATTPACSPSSPASEGTNASVASGPSLGAQPFSERLELRAQPVGQAGAGLRVVLVELRELLRPELRIHLQ